MSADTVNSRAVKWARQQHTGGPAEKAVLLILAAEANGSASCSLSTRTLAEKADTNQATARRLLERLRARGLVSWSAGAGHATNTYYLRI